MKTKLVHLVVMAVLLSACVGAGRAPYVQAHPDLEPEVRAAILEGEVQIGMTSEEVLASWGKPRRQTSVYRAGLGRFELWTYVPDLSRVTYATLHLRDGVVVGWGSP